MYTDSTLRVLNDGQAFTHEDGTNYPGNYPKDEIIGLFLVTETIEPTDSNLIVDGFIIDESYTQVWQTRLKTQEELDKDIADGWARVNALQNRMLGVDKEATWRSARYREQQLLNAQSTTETIGSFQLLLDYRQQIRDSDQTIYSTPQDALDALNALITPTPIYN